MSHTQFVSTATLTVVDDFNLQSYLDALFERCVKEENFLFEEYGEIDGKVDIEFGEYVRQVGSNILIECDTEESNGNSEVYDWLIEQFLPVMTSEFAEIKSALVRSGVDVNVEFYTKDRKCISTDDIRNILKQYIKMSAWPLSELAHNISKRPFPVLWLRSNRNQRTDEVYQSTICYSWWNWKHELCE